MASLRAFRENLRDFRRKKPLSTRFTYRGISNALCSCKKTCFFCNFLKFSAFFVEFLAKCVKMSDILHVLLTCIFYGIILLPAWVHKLVEGKQPPQSTT